MQKFVFEITHPSWWGKQASHQSGFSQNKPFDGLKPFVSEGTDPALKGGAIQICICLR
jgi:hypothetical protein